MRNRGGGREHKAVGGRTGGNGAICAWTSASKGPVIKRIFRDGARGGRETRQEEGRNVWVGGSRWVEAFPK